MTDVTHPPEWDAVLAVLHLDRSPAALAAVGRALGGMEKGRGPLWRLAADFGYGPLLHYYLEQAGDACTVEPELRARLAGAFEGAALRAGVLRREALSLSRRLGEAGVPVLWVKGIWLATFVCERPALRFMEDVDLVVPEDRFERSCEIATEGGYEVDPLDALARREAHARPFRKSVPPAGRDGYVRVDLHSRLQLGDRVCPGADALWASAQETPLAGVRVHVPSPEWGLLLAALHAFGHACDPKYALSAVADAAAILRRHAGTLDWAWLEDRASDPRVATAMYVLTALAGGEPTSHVALRFRQAIGERLEALAVRPQADRVVRDSRRLDRLRVTDFSLFRFGESGSLVRNVPRELRDFFSPRGRQVTRLGDGDSAVAAPVGIARQMSRLLGSNWRFAAASYRAGRLSARVQRAQAPDPRRPGS